MNALESTLQSSKQSLEQRPKAARKILLVIGDITRKGGIERVVVNLANAFVQILWAMKLGFVAALSGMIGYLMS